MQDVVSFGTAIAAADEDQPSTWLMLVTAMLLAVGAAYTISLELAPRVVGIPAGTFDAQPAYEQVHLSGSNCPTPTCIPNLLPHPSPPHWPQSAPPPSPSPVLRLHAQRTAAIAARLQLWCVRGRRGAAAGGAPRASMTGAAHERQGLLRQTGSLAEEEAFSHKGAAAAADDMAEEWGLYGGNCFGWRLTLT